VRGCKRNTFIDPISYCWNTYAEHKNKHYKVDFKSVSVSLHILCQSKKVNTTARTSATRLCSWFNNPNVVHSIKLILMPMLFHLFQSFFYINIMLIYITYRQVFSETQIKLAYFTLAKCRRYILAFKNLFTIKERILVN